MMHIYHTFCFAWVLIKSKSSKETDQKDSLMYGVVIFENGSNKVTNVDDLCPSKVLSVNYLYSFYEFIIFNESLLFKM